MLSFESTANQLASINLLTLAQPRNKNQFELFECSRALQPLSIPMNVLLSDSRTGLLSFSFSVLNVLNLDIIQSNPSRIQIRDAFRSLLIYGIFNWKFLEILRRCLTLDRLNHVVVARSMFGVESWPFNGIYKKKRRKNTGLFILF